jgi:hypothetical protein
MFVIDVIYVMRATLHRLQGLQQALQVKAQLVDRDAM